MMSAASEAPDPLTRTARAEFPLEQGLIYLGHAAVAPLPRRAADAVTGFCRSTMRRPTLDYGRWLAAEAGVRRRLCELLGASDVDDLAIVKNTSEAIALVAGGLPWQAGDNVVLPRKEFLSNRLPWQALSRQGVEVREVDLGAGTDPAPLIAACDGRTRLVAGSSVRYDSGARLDLAPLSAFTRRHRILLCIDVIQGLGAVRFDLGSTPCDFVVGGSHKWLLGPEGVGFLWSTPQARAQLALRQWGWRMLERPFDFDAPGRAPASTARRFEPGTMNMMGIVAFEASLSVFDAAGGMGAVERAVLERTALLLEAAGGMRGVRVVTPAGATRHAGITALAPAGGAAQAVALCEALREQGIHATVRGGWLRLAPHFHTPVEDLQRTTDAIAALLR